MWVNDNQGGCNGFDWIMDYKWIFFDLECEFLMVFQLSIIVSDQENIID